jgi:hypothetical protein
MSRSLLVLLSSCALAALLLAPGSATAQDFTEADLVGDYAFTVSNDSDSQGGGGRSTGMRILGRFTADGLGSVSGSRTWLRPVWPDLALRTQAIEQEFTGTYSVESDGRGVMTVTATPNSDWLSVNGLTATVFEEPELHHFVLANGGRNLGLTMDLNANHIRIADGSSRGGVTYGLVGDAEAQDSAVPAPDPRIDVLTDELAILREENARQSAQLCEVLRLLNTPQGQRETSTPEVLDACGTGYEWNERP